VVLRVVGDLGIPVAYGLKSGHVTRDNFTLPFGVRAQFMADASVSLGLTASVTSEPLKVSVPKS
jgi:muramoyltetrapeptide carboxypeptidase LdcA involved in peptidoglycan recycling